MTIIQAKTADQVLSAVLIPKIAPYNHNSVKLTVDFDSSWNGYGKSAMFFTKNIPTPYEKILDADDACLVPPEVLTESGQLFITLKGINVKGEIKTSTILRVKISGGAPLVVTSDPSSDVYSQLLAAYGVINGRFNSAISAVAGSTEVTDIRVGADGKTYSTAGESVRTQFNNVNSAIDKIRGYAYMAEGELIIDAANAQISANSLLLLTSDKTFVYVTNVSAPINFDSTVASVRSIFAVKTDKGNYEIRIGTDSEMKNYKNVYYICGYYSKQLIGGNFSPNLQVTINGVTNDAAKVTYNGAYTNFVAALNECDEKLNESYQKLIDFVYNISSVNEYVVEFTANHLTPCNVSIDASGELGTGANLKRLAVQEMLPSYNSDEIEIIMSDDTNYACNIYLFDENKAFVSSAYHNGSKGTIKAAINAAYFRVMIARTSGENIDITELVKIRLHSVKRKTTLEMIPDILLSDKTTRIKLLGDSITQGMGSTGYIGYTVIEGDEEISVRGNGSEYPYKDEDYVEGDYLGELGARRWYESTSSTGWSNRLKAYFESKFDCIVKNYGMSGIGSANLDALCSPLVNDDDDIIILMIGTNDRTTTTKANFKNNVTNFVNHLLEKNKRIVLMGSVPVSVENESGCDYHMEDVNNILKTVAYSCDVPFISVYDDFIDYCDSRNISVDALLSDGLHPNDEGYEVMFRIISKRLGISTKRNGATW